MWTALPAALMAIILLADQTFAEKETTTIYACESVSSTGLLRSSKAAAASGGVFNQNLSQSHFPFGLLSFKTRTLWEV